MKSAASFLMGLCLMAHAVRVFAAFNASSGYQAETDYANPHADATVVSFDWDANTNLYYSTGKPNWDLGFAVYRYDGATLSNIYTDTAAFAGSRVTAIGGHIYFNDGGSYERWTYDYFKYDPAQSAAPTNMGITSDLWGLETRHGGDVWAAGGYSAAIHYSVVDAQGNWTSNPLIQLGAIGNASGPLAFDADGNLFYTEGYNTGGPTVYRWSAAEVSAALADPAGAPLSPTNHAWATLGAGDGATGMLVDDDGHPVITATSFTDPSELHRLLTLNGACIGYEVLARSDERLTTARRRDGVIYASSANGIFTVTPNQTLRLIGQSGIGGAVMVIGLNEQRQTLRLSTVAQSAPQWIARGIDGNRLLAQAGDGGASAIVELNAANQITNIVTIAAAAPGWIARALDGNRILAQAGDGGMVGIQELGAEYALGKFKVVLDTAPGWIARDLDGNRLLGQQGDGGAIMIAQLNASGEPAGFTTVAGAIPGWIARSLSGNLLLAQEGDGGMSIVMELNPDESPAGFRLALNPAPGFALAGMDVR